MSLSKCNSEKNHPTPSAPTLNPIVDSSGVSAADSNLSTQAESVSSDSVIPEIDSIPEKPKMGNEEKEIHQHGTPDPDKLKEIKEEKNKKKKK